MAAYISIVCAHVRARARVCVCVCVRAPKMGLLIPPTFFFLTNRDLQEELRDCWSKSQSEVSPLHPLPPEGKSILFDFLSVLRVWLLEQTAQQLQ